MIRVRFYYRRRRIRRLSVKGHAGFAEYGRDIVCAAVSVLAQTAVLALRMIAGLEPKVRLDQGLLEISLPARASHEAEAKAFVILDTVALGLAEIAKEHPRYVSIEHINSRVKQVSGFLAGQPTKSYRKLQSVVGKTGLSRAPSLDYGNSCRR